MTILGIDPGATGALVWLDELGTGGVWERMPAIPREGVSGRDLLELLEERRPDVAVVERVQAFPGMGVTGAVTYGTGYGVILGVLLALRIPHDTVRPDRWHKDLIGRVKREPGADRYAARREAKARAAAHVQAVAPRLELPRAAGAREAVVDAACLALWGRRYGPWRSAA